MKPRRAVFLFLEIVMANVLNSGQFTLGPNNSLAIYDANGEVNWGIPTTISWESNAVIERKPINLMIGERFDLLFNQGWKGGFDIQRSNGSLDQYWSVLEAQVRAGLKYPTFTIVQTIRETDGSISRYSFIGASISYDNAGKFMNEEGVVQTLNFTAPVREVEVTPAT